MMVIDIKLPLPNRLLWISRKVIFFIFFLSACSFWGQVDSKLEQSPINDPRWHTMVPQQIASDGKWTSYSLYYPKQGDTLFLLNTQTGRKFEIPNGSYHQFSNDSKWFFSIDSKKNLSTIDLKAEKPTYTPNVSTFKITDDSKYLAYMEDTEAAKGNTLILRNLEKGSSVAMENVTDFIFNKSGSRLAYVVKDKEESKLIVRDLAHKRDILLARSKNEYDNITWATTGNGLAFYERISENTILHWIADLNNPTTITQFDPQKIGLKISEITSESLYISPDLKTVFFYASQDKTTSADTAKDIDAATVEIWNTKDEFLYPAYKKIKKSLENPDILISWTPSSGFWQFLGDSLHSKTILGKDAKFAYATTNKNAFIPANDLAIASDILIYDLETKKEKRVMEKAHDLEFHVSPLGNFMVYFKQDNWWCYNAKTQQHTNLTKDIFIDFTNKNARTFPAPSFGLPGWSHDGTEVFLYDEFDVWTINLYNQKAEKLTYGRKEKTVFRFYTQLASPYRNIDGLGSHATTFDLKEGVIFNARNLGDERTGYFTFNSNEGLREIVFGNSLFSNLRLAANGTTVVYTEERYDLPPRLIYKNLSSKESSILFQSNPQHFEYSWGKSELVYYQTEKDSLKGVLYYPSNFDPKKKYPMIVHYYEEWSHKLNNYIFPSNDVEYGFNIANYTSQDYFVFCPDIAYEIGNPGMSAVACITSGVDKVLEFPFIDSKKIGAYGHSWGGYETMFLITQTNRFATAVAGAGFSDLRSFYFSMAWLWDIPQSWRFERFSIRLGKGYFDAPHAYESNSPLNFTENIKTPFLSWTGDQDTNANWEQTVAFFLALRKLNKEHIMLLYRNEGHVMATQKNALDLTVKMNQWFDFYLKDIPPPAWIKEAH